MKSATHQAQQTNDFCNIGVTITSTPDGKGNAGNGKYNVVYSQDPIPVTKRSTVLRFRLTDTSPTIVFTGLVTNLPGIAAQLSTYSISRDGRDLICTDIDNVTENIQVTLQWVDGVNFSHDPQVGNVSVPPG